MSLYKNYKNYKKYANGGCPNPPCDDPKKKPIYTNNPKDPRLRAYNDSLTLSNRTAGDVENLLSKGAKMLNQRPLTSNEQKWYSGSPIKPTYMQEETMGTITGYKKPVQPVIYQKPQQQNNGLPKGYSTYIKPKGQRVQDTNWMSYEEWIKLQPDSNAKPGFKYRADNIEGQIRNLAIPVGTPTPQRPKSKLLDPSIPAMDMSTGTRPVPHNVNMPQVNYDTTKPTKYSFTYPTGVGQNGQETMYMPTKSLLQNYIKGKKGVSSQEGSDYMTATGYLADGGSLSDADARSSQALGIKSKPSNGAAISTGDIGANSFSGPLSAASSITTALSSVADAYDPANEYGHQRAITQGFKGGMQMGVLGSTLGLVKAHREQREEKILKAQEQGLAYNYAVSKYSAKAAADPTISRGVVGEELYSNGGSLTTKYLQKKMGLGGSLSQISSDTVEVKGPSHAQGGVALSTVDEVEGGETIKGSYVMSKKNGFADLHKPLAKAIGILEKKAITIASTNSLQRLRDKEDALILFQEQFNQAHNLK